MYAKLLMLYASGQDKPCVGCHQNTARLLHVCSQWAAIHISTSILRLNDSVSIALDWIGFQGSEFTSVCPGLGGVPGRVSVVVCLC